METNIHQKSAWDAVEAEVNDVKLYGSLTLIEGTIIFGLLMVQQYYGAAALTVLCGIPCAVRACRKAGAAVKTLQSIPASQPG